MIIYKITNKVNNKIYIGQTIRSLKERVQEHIRKKGTLNKAFNKYGIENFSIEIIEKCNSTEELNNKEIYWINRFNCLTPNGYNLCEGGGQTNGYTHKEESKNKMSVNRGRYYKEQNPFYGKTHTLEQKQKWSIERKGRDLSKAKEFSIKSRQRKVINLDTEEVFNSIKEASNKFNLKDTHITRVCKGKRNKTGGYRWQYYEEYMAISCQASES